MTKEMKIYIKSVSNIAKKETGEINNMVAWYYEKNYKEECAICGKKTSWELDFGCTMPIGKDCLKKHFECEGI